MEEMPAPRPPRDSWSQVSALLNVAMELGPEREKRGWRR